MLYENVHVFAGTLRLIDSAILGLSALVLWAAGAHAELWPGGQNASLPLFACSIVLTFFVLSQRRHLYYPRRTEELLREAIALFETTVCAAGVSCLLTEALTAGLPGAFYVASSVCGIAMILASRVIIRSSLRAWRRGGHDVRNWLIVGRNPRSAEVVREILSNPQFGVHVAAVLDLPARGDRDNQERLQDFAQPSLSSVPYIVVDHVERVREVIINGIIDEVVVELPYRSYYNEIQAILEICFEGGVPVRLPSKIFASAVGRPEFSDIGNISMVAHRGGPSDRALLPAKRLIDIFGAAFGLIALAPLHMAIAIAIKLTSPGPVLFTQKRVGLHGRPFTMIKYRTMVANAPDLHASIVAQSERDGPAFKMKGDPRVTAVGRFLRKYHLDELPQLWNVLYGEMSLVGPRPLPLQEASGEEWWQRRRCSMAPGLTCLWQVSGDYRMSFAEWMRLDLEYIDKWSLWLDLRLILGTAAVVLRGPGW